MVFEHGLDGFSFVLEGHMRLLHFRRWVVLAMVDLVAVAGCAVDTAGLVSDDSSNDGGSLDDGLRSISADLASSLNTAQVALPPTLKAGVDPSIFLPVSAVGYHPTAGEAATSGQACASDVDCATSDGQVVFHCSLPYYGHAQCQGAFPLGYPVTPGVTPSCAYYDCPAAYQCEADARSHSLACLYAP